MVGAETAEIFNTVRPILQAMGKSVFNCEKPGAGQIAKICNNMALAIQMISVA
jgi:3-hydroxyisobutyrate dehydrogenase